MMKSDLTTSMKTLIIIKRLVSVLKFDSPRVLGYSPTALGLFIVCINPLLFYMFQIDSKCIRGDISLNVFAGYIATTVSCDKLKVYMTESLNHYAFKHTQSFRNKTNNHLFE